MKFFTRITFVLLICFSFANVSNAREINGVYDPLESVNRAVFSFNAVVDNFLIKPVARGYSHLPEVPKTRIRSVLNNLREPVTFINAVLQLDAERSFTAFWRFVVNSTWGIGGLFDFATVAGLEYQEEDFGQTLGHYGVGEGPYLVLPLLGSSNIRDLVGTVVDSVADPYNNYVEGVGIAAKNVLDVTDLRARLLPITDRIEETSLDPYATYRSLYTQRRNNAIENKDQ